MTDLQRRAAPAALGRPQLLTRADGPPRLGGYAAVFYRAGDPATEYQVYPDLVERIMPGAFDAALREDEVWCLWAHEAPLVLGRTTSGTLRLSVDEVGLRYEVDLPDTQAGRDAAASVGRGDVSGTSFGFRFGKRGRVRVIREETADGGRLEIMELHELELVEISPCPFPAYRATETELRARPAERAELAAWYAAAAAAASPASGPHPFAVGVRLRLLELHGHA